MRLIKPEDTDYNSIMLLRKGVYNAWKYNSMVRYYTDLIQSNKDWIFVGVYADKAITGTKIDKRDEFQRIIQDCMDGKIDMIIAKSIYLNGM